MAGGEIIDASDIIRKYTKKASEVFSLGFPIQQNINGKVVQVIKHLPIDLGLHIVEPAPAILTKHKRIGEVSKGKTGTVLNLRTKHRKGDKVVITLKSKDSVSPEFIRILEKLLDNSDSEIEINYTPKLSTEKLSIASRNKLQKTLLDSSVMSIIENLEFDDELLRPFLDFNYEMPKKVFKKVVKKCGFNTTQWAEIIGVNEDRINSSRAFNHQQSMHILKILLLFNHSLEVFNDKAYFKRWLKKKSVDLGNTPPYFYLDSPSGIDVVRKRLDRIDAGIFS